jgi:hypothetical protein
MEREQLVVINLDEIAARWQIPVARVMYLIAELDMPVDDAGRGEWFADHSDLILKEKQDAFEASLFPRHSRPEPTKTPA